MFVYLITNKVNGKKYVGQHSGNNLQKYWNITANRALANPGNRRVLYRAVRKYGIENFEIKPLVIVDNKWEMDLYETGMIRALDLMNPDKGYNLTLGGEGTPGYRPSEETLQKLSDSHKGIFQSEETKQKRAAKIRGLKRSDETKG